jgi:hypothetical protein
VTAARTAVGGDVLLLTAATITATCSYSEASAPYNLTAVAVGAVACVLAIVGFGVGIPDRWAIAVAAVISLVPQVLRPPGKNVVHTAFYPWSVALGLAATGLLLCAVFGAFARVRWWLLGTGFGAMASAIIFAIPGGQHPQVDVWSIFQQSAAALSHGRNPYEITAFVVPAGQTANCFNYLPATFLGSWPGWAAVGDVRYAETAVMLAGWLALGWALIRRTVPAEAGGGAERRFGALTLLLTAMTMAGTLRMAQQAWNESLILGCLLIAAALMMTGRAGWAWLPVAVALATKQHVVLLLGVLAVWPCFGWRRSVYAVLAAAAISGYWVLDNFDRFRTCTVDFFLDIQPRHDSVSLFRFVPSAVQNAAVVLALLTGFVVAVRYLPRTVAGLLVGSALVLLAFDLFNKQTFENQWWLLAQLLVCGLAVRVVEVTRPSGQPSPDPRMSVSGR